MVMSVRPSIHPSVRPSVTVFRTFLLHTLTYWAEILHMTLFCCTTDPVQVLSIFVSFCRSYAPFGTKNNGNAPFGTKNTGNTQFYALFSYMLWHIELKACIWLYFNVYQIKFEFRQFPSIFVGVLPLLELRILEIHSFSALFSYMPWHFELKFCIWLYFTVLQIKLKCCRFSSIFVGVMPLLDLSILQIHNFLDFCPTCFDILSWNFAYDLTLLQIKFKCQQFASIFVGVMPILELKYLKHTVFCTFLLQCTCFGILNWNFAYDCNLCSSVINFQQFV